MILLLRSDRGGRAENLRASFARHFSQSNPITLRRVEFLLAGKQSMSRKSKENERDLP
jgi:hypothetical protein